MCSSMEDKNPQPTEPHKLNSDVPTHHENPSKLVNDFLYKATIFTVFLVILPLLPSILPEFINLNLHSKTWELLQLICVGIAVSYGLFSKKNEGIVDKEPHYSLFDNANSYISRLLHVSSVFDDEVENPSAFDDHEENKLQSWSSQYHREEPIVMVANESQDLEEQIATSLKVEEKPLLLPIRSLKSLVSESNAAESSLSDRPDSTYSGSNRLARNSRKSEKGDAMKLSPQKLEEKIVHPSPIPWRSRSGRMEMKLDEDIPLMEDSETNFRRSRLSRSFKLNSTTNSSPPTRSSRFSNIPTESKAEITDDSVRRKIHYPKPSPPPPPPPPPPPASFLHNKPIQLKSYSGLSKNNDFVEINLRNSVQSVKNDSQSRKTNSGSELRARAQADEKVIAGEIGGLKKESLMEHDPKEEKSEVGSEIESESESESESEEDDDFERSMGNSESACDKEEAANEIATTDVDKKADEFIAKFREQIRSQRIKSIRSSNDHHSKYRLR